MSALGNKEIMARNIKRYMQKMGISRKDFCERLGFAYSTVTDWLNAEKYPRIDKIEMMANFFGISKADLVEPPTSPAPPEPQKNIETPRAPKEDREHKHLKNLLSDPHLRRILESSGQLNESSLQEVQNFIDFQLGKKKQ